MSEGDAGVARHWAGALGPLSFCGEVLADVETATIVPRTRPLLRVEDLRVWFPIRRGFLSRVQGNVRAVDGVSLVVHRGDTLGLVGESGCGKTTLGRAVLQLIRPTLGQVFFDDSPDLSGLSASELRPYRQKMQIVFQDPFSSLNPRMTVGGALAEAATVFERLDRARRRARVRELLQTVGLSEYDAVKYPHEFSGGQRQRVGIARALAVSPELIIADEPVSALDVSVQAQIINLFKELQENQNLSYIFISHDLSVVRFVSHRVAVMYLGHIVELESRHELFDNPLHPYTNALLTAVPVVDPKSRRKRIILHGDVPNPANPPEGCPFHPRCPKVIDLCRTTFPSLEEHAPGHWASCIRIGS